MKRRKTVFIRGIALADALPPLGQWAPPRLDRRPLHPRHDPGAGPFLQDYDAHKNYFLPEVTDSRLVGRDGDNWRLRYRVVKRYILTVVVNSDQTANFYPLSSTRMITRSVATHIAEVKNAGKTGERELDSTIVWRLNTYWRLEENDGGVYVECQTISLTRAAPAGLGWLVNPIVRSLSGASLAHLFEATRTGAQSRIR